MDSAGSKWTGKYEPQAEEGAVWVVCTLTVLLFCKVCCVLGEMGREMRRKEKKVEKE
jgi:hypothetical protein